MLFTLPAALLRAEYDPIPLDVTVTQQQPYEYAGIVLNATDDYEGSGAVVGNSRLVISCAHVPFNGTSLVWSTDNLWFRAYESSTVPAIASGQVLRGCMHFDSYASLVSANGQNSNQAFSKDFTAYYAYEDLGPGCARFWYDGQAALLLPATKTIVGYPVGIYADGDYRQFLMHQTGPFSMAFSQVLGSVNEIDTVVTGPGNSGGPVFVTDESCLTDPDQGLRFAAVLVSEYTVSENGPFTGSGVVAATAPEWDLVNNALSAIGVAPLNDSWAAALRIFGDTVTDTVNNQFATEETGEPNHAGNAGGHSLWWRWVAPGDGPVVMNTQGSTCNTLLAVYTGSSVSALTAIASNSSGGTTSTLNITAAAGTEYWIAADGKDGATGSITLNVSYAPTAPPANDNFANATKISGLSAYVIGNNINATKEPGEPNFPYADSTGKYSPGGKSVWWTWTAPVAGQVFLTTGGTSFDTILVVYTGTAVNALTEVAADDDPPDAFADSSALTFTASAGTTYWFSVDGFSDATHSAPSGAISLSLNLTPNIPVLAVQPTAQTPNIGDSVVLAAAARGSGLLTYQWYLNGTAISGATNATYQIASFQTANAGDYTVVVRNSNGSVTSNVARLWPRGYPNITTQPASQTVWGGDTATITVAVTSGTAVAYRWQKNGVNLTDDGRISGSTSATLTIPNLQTADAGSYTVLVTNIAGSMISTAAILTVIPSLPSGGVVSISAGGSHTLLVGSDGSLWATGNNNYGQLGDGTAVGRSRPVQVATSVAAASAGDSHSLFIKSDGSLWGMGYDVDGELGDGQGHASQTTPVQIATDVVAAAAGSGHSLFIKSDGTLWAMGGNGCGQLGDGTTTGRFAPVQVASRVVAVSAGYDQSLFIRSDDSLWAMGNNNFGQLGDGTTTLRTTPVKIADGVIAAAAGDGFSLFLKSDGSLWGSGNSNYGQLGVNGWWNSTPVLLASGVTGMSAGDSHTLFLKSNSTLWAMGYNDYGQLGDGTATSRSSPVQVDDGVIAESAGDSDTIFLKADSRVWATGYNFTGQLGDGTTTNRSNPVPMIGGTAFSPSAPAGLTASAGTVVNAVRLSWNPTVGAANYEIWRSSSNDFSGATLLASNVPSAIYFDATAAIGTTYYYWVEAANQVGTSGASTVSSGYNVPWIAPSIVTPPTDQAANIGEHATFTTAAAGDPVPTLQWQRAPAGSTTWSDLAEGTSYVGVTSPTLTVYGTTFAMNGDQFRCVASNTDAQVISNAAKLTVRPVAGVVAVVGGQFYNLFIRADGTLWGTGDNGRGELGDGTTTNRTMPVQVANGVVTAAAGAAHSLFVKSDGTLWAMGSNSNGQLGDGTTTNHTMPVQVANGVVTASCGAAHSLFVKSDGTLWAMGSNSNGQLGDGTNMDRSTPVQVANGVVAVSAGGSHSLFVKSDGTLWAVGWNGSGQLGDGTNTSRTSPVQVASGVATVAAGLEHSLFVKSDGTLWGMGNSGDGELGYVTTIACTSPVQVASDVVTAAAGANHSVFVKSDSTLWAMGYDWGHFEIFSPGAGGTVIPATCLVQIASDVVAVAAGNSNSLFAKSDGTLWAMGDNYSGELGDGSLISRWTPVQVGGGLPQLPEMPSGLTASQGTFPCAVFLSWIPVIGANHYEVWRNTANSAATAALIAGNVSGALYSDSAAVPAISYYYWVRAVNFAGASDYCGSANGSIPLIAPAVTTQPASREVVSGQSVSFSIAVSASPAPSYQWQRSVNGGNDWSNLANDTTYSGVTTATLTVSGATLAMRAHQFRCAVDNGVGSVATSPAVLTVDPALVVTTFAGMGGFRGFADGTGSAAQFQYPAGIAIDGSGNLFVADTNNCTIRKVTSAGVVSTLAGSPLNFGSADGVGSAAQFDFPSGIATDGSGNLYVADASNHTIRRVTQAGVVTTVAGVAGHSGCTDGTGSMALFSFPSGIATDGSGNMYVADTNNTIRKVTPVGVVTTLAGMGGLSGSVDGTGTSAQFNFPKNIAIDATRNLYVTDTNNNTIRKITPAGVVTTIAGLAGYYGNSDGAGSVARFAQPAGVAVDSVGNLYVTDGNNTIRRVTPGGVVTTVAGLAGFYGNSDGTGSAAQFYLPVGLVVDSTGSLYIMDAGNDTIRKGVFQTVPLLTGQPSNEAAVTGQSVRLAVGLSGWSPANCQWQCSTNNGTTWSNLANDGTDSGATTSALTIANVTPGMNGWQYRCQVSSSTQANETSSAATLMIVGPPSFATQPADQVVFVGASANFTVTTNGAPAPGCQWRASTDGGTTWSDLNNGDTYAGVTTATLTVRGATLAMNGSLYRCVATNSEGTATSNNGSLSVFPQVLAPAAGAGEGVVSSGFVLNWSSVSGATGYRLDVSTDSSFGSFVNGYQNLDVGSATSKALSGLNANTTYYVRVRAYNGAGVGANSSTITVTTTPTISITTPLTVSTLAGQVLSTGSADGTGNAARFYYPSGVAADSAGNLYIADTDNHTLRKVIASTGAVTTLAGLAGNSGSADATGSAARFNNPSGVAVDGAGNIYVADTLNHTLRKVTSAGVVSTLAGATGSNGSADGTGSAARFQGPQGLAFNSSGVLYVADTNNHTIRMVVPSTGVVTTVAGLAGNSGSSDGLGSVARFNYPSGVAVDSAGNIYVADTENHTIRAITPSGLVTTSAGLAGSSGGADGAGSASRFNSPAAISVDPSGNVYVADTDNHTIRMIVTSTGTTSTLAGLAGTSGSADGIGAAVRFFAPTGLAMDHNSNLYIADTNNDTLRVGLLPAIPAIQNQPQSQTVTAGSSVQFSVTASGRPAPTYQWYFNSNAITGATGNSYSLTNAQASNAGNYTVAVTNAMGGKTSDPATLTVTPVTSPPSGGGGGGGGGGAPSLWFCGSLLLLAAARRSFGRRQQPVGLRPPCC